MKKIFIMLLSVMIMLTTLDVSVLGEVTQNEGAEGMLLIRNIMVAYI